MNLRFNDRRYEVIESKVVRKPGRVSVHCCRMEPRVGIFWLVNGRLVADTTPLAQAERYLHFRIHSGDHITVWEKLKQDRTVPAEMEYDEAPRGQAIYDTVMERFTLLADRCILRNDAAMQQITDMLGLPIINLPGDVNGTPWSHLNRR